ncbi:MAG: hypothetical protein QXY45_00830 [Candidatus Aenigmatarchaeota archaeon]
MEVGDVRYNPGGFFEYMNQRGAWVRVSPGQIFLVTDRSDREEKVSGDQLHRYAGLSGYTIKLANYGPGACRG